MDMRNDFGSYQDPIATYTSLGGDLEPTFVTDNFPFNNRRASLLSSASSGPSLSSASSGPSLSFSSSPTDAASSSIPTTPVNEVHRAGGVLTPADMMLTPESPCPQSWGCTSRLAAPAGVATYPQQRYPNACQDLTRNMLNAGAASYHDDFQASQHNNMSGRDMAFAALDPIQTQYSAQVQRGTYYPPFMNDYRTSHSYPSSSTLSDEESFARSWALDEEVKCDSRQTSSRDPVSITKARRVKTRGADSPDLVTTHSGVHKCHFSNCNDKRFRRKEHLRRHLQSKHGECKFECLQGRILGSRFCHKLHGIDPISRSDNVNQHSCTHVINGMGKTRNALCELAVAEACIRKDVRTPSELDKATKQCEAVRLHMRKNAEESAAKGVRTAKPKANVHISHDIMQGLGFDCSQGCPQGTLHVFDGNGSHGPLCMAFIGNVEPRDEMMVVLDGDLDPALVPASKLRHSAAQNWKEKHPR